MPVSPNDVFPSIGRGFAIRLSNIDSYPKLRVLLNKIKAVKLTLIIDRTAMKSFQVIASGAEFSIRNVLRFLSQYKFVLSIQCDDNDHHRFDRLKQWEDWLSSLSRRYHHEKGICSFVKLMPTAAELKCNLKAADFSRLLNVGGITRVVLARVPPIFPNPVVSLVEENTVGQEESKAVYEGEIYRSLISKLKNIGNEKMELVIDLLKKTDRYGRVDIENIENFFILCDDISDAEASDIVSISLCIYLSLADTRTKDKLFVSEIDSYSEVSTIYDDIDQIVFSNFLVMMAKVLMSSPQFSFDRSARKSVHLSKSITGLSVSLDLILYSHSNKINVIVNLPVVIGSGTYKKVFLSLSFSFDTSLEAEFRRFIRYKLIKDENTEVCGVEYDQFPTELRYLCAVNESTSLPAILCPSDQKGKFYDTGIKVKKTSSRRILFPLADKVRVEDLSDIEKFKIFFREVVEQLSVLHDRRLIHRDLKFPNLVRHSDGYRIIDFGAAEKICASESQTYHDSVKTTFHSLSVNELIYRLLDRDEYCLKYFVSYVMSGKSDSYLAVDQILKLFPALVPIESLDLCHSTMTFEALYSKVIRTAAIQDPYELSYQSFLKETSAQEKPDWYSQLLCLLYNNDDNLQTLLYYDNQTSEDDQHGEKERLGAKAPAVLHDMLGTHFKYLFFPLKLKQKKVTPWVHPTVNDDVYALATMVYAIYNHVRGLGGNVDDGYVALLKALYERLSNPDFYKRLSLNKLNQVFSKDCGDSDSKDLLLALATI